MTIERERVAPPRSLSSGYGPAKADSDPAGRALVVGAGPAGLISALALADAGVRTTVAAPAWTAAQARRETRTAALFGGNIDLLHALGVWPALEPSSAQIVEIRLIDDTGRLLRAPEVALRAEEIGGDAFGWNIPNAALVGVLEAAARSHPAIERIETAAITVITAAADRVTARTAEGSELAAALLVGADGRNSRAREAAAIAIERWDYPQAAIVCRLDHTWPHRGVSYELHRRAGPLTTVPMPGRSSSLVWVETREEASRLTALDEGAFGRELEHRLQGLLGTMTGFGPRAAFPLSALKAERMAARRIALVGEAGHVVPPIGAQGLNLGIRDAAVLAELVEDARFGGGDIGAPVLLADYARRRQADISVRSLGIDLLNRSLFSSFAPLGLARGVGLHMLSRVDALRRLVMREGVQPSATTTRAMRRGRVPGVEVRSAVASSSASSSASSPE